MTGPKFAAKSKVTCRPFRTKELGLVQHAQIQIIPLMVSTCGYPGVSTIRQETGDFQKTDCPIHSQYIIMSNLSCNIMDTYVLTLPKSPYPAPCSPSLMERKKTNTVQDWSCPIKPRSSALEICSLFCPILQVMPNPRCNRGNLQMVRLLIQKCTCDWRGCVCIMVGECRRT